MSKGHSWLKPFSNIKKCSKCGGKIKTEYYDGERQLEQAMLFGGLKGTGMNYLIKTCDECGFSWKEEPKDGKIND